jgi:hypothetical protein
MTPPLKRSCLNCQYRGPTSWDQDSIYDFCYSCYSKVKQSGVMYFYWEAFPIPIEELR